MSVVFYIAATVAILSTAMVILQARVVHALLYLVVSFLSIAVIFFTLGAPFVAALEVIIYAGAIMVLFVFVILMLGSGPKDSQEKEWFHPRMLVGPMLLGLILLADLVYVLSYGLPNHATQVVMEPKAVGIALFGPYLIAVELASMLLLAGLAGAYHLGRRAKGATEKGGKL